MVQYTGEAKTRKIGTQRASSLMGENIAAEIGCMYSMKDGRIVYHVFHNDLMAYIEKLKNKWAEENGINNKKPVVS